MPDIADTIDIGRLSRDAQALVETARRAGADAADVVVASSRSSGVRVRDGVLEDTESEESDAFSLRVLVGRRAATVSAGREGDPKRLAERAVAMARVAPENPYAGLAPEERLAREWPELDLADRSAPSRDEMQQMALACEEAALSTDGVTKSSGGGFGTGVSGAVLATSHGFLGSYVATRHSLSVSVIAEADGRMEVDYDFDSARHREDLRSAEEIGREAGRRAARRTRPRVLDTRSVPVIYEPRVARGLVGHLSAAMNGASVARGTSLFRDKMGEGVAASGITIVDEPHVARGPASRPFDGEGLAMSDLTMIENGVLRAFWLDTASARELDLSPNARGTRSGATTVPVSTNTTLLAGTRSVRDMMRDVGTGLLVTDMIGHGANLVTGDYSRGCSGLWFEDGEVAFPVTEMTLGGNLMDMFMHMEPADDLERGHGTNAPSVLVEGLTLAGR